ncbi:MAG: DUF1588 domain-containing protein [Archangium sp.]
MNRLLLSIAAVLALTSCEGSLVGPRAERPVVTPPVIDDPTTPEKCEPTGQEVQKLLRVSNYEYQAMVSDVLGIDVTNDYFTQWTPIAQVYGFDTMSEQRIDSQALEVQLDTTERLAKTILATPALVSHCPTPAQPQTPVCTVKQSYSGTIDFSDTQGRDCWSYRDSANTMMSFDNTRSLWRKLPDENALIWATGMHPGSTVDPVMRWTTPLDGTIALTGSFADADPGGGDGVIVNIRRNGNAIWTQTIPNGGNASFSLNVNVVRGDLLDFVVSPNANPSYDTTGHTISMAYTATPLKAAWTWDNCVGPLVTRIASHGFRRPVRADETTDYRALFESQRQAASAAGFPEPVDEAMQAVLQAVLLSPNFTFKPELVPNGLDTSERAYGTASRLALFFRSSVADQELWTLAESGALNDQSVVKAQAARLIESDNARFTRHFGGQWLDFREGPDLGPLTASMIAEPRDVFAEVLKSDLPAERLLSPGFTMADASLAYHYSLAFPMGNDLVRKINGNTRGGLLQQAHFLTRTATGSEFRRPIHRGLWALTRLLCRSLPHLDAATLEEINASIMNIDRSLPLAQQMAAHRSAATRCSGCHNMMDPIGLALEKYDKQGLWRDAYPNGAPITSDLKLDGVTVADPNQLTTAIENNPDYRACVAQKLLTFGLNRGPLDGELCVARQIARPMDGSTPTLKQMTLDALDRSMQLTEVTP